ncbi:hypothetical protein GCM10010896_08900 [Mammaliicoccus stepanovicii]|nr:hypothetical protein [Mammaliicoccus stepanovicii]GGI40543.1 hypothetical protein GCM10010896_08900 [Mammaliicoccus stepanovicii]
MISDLETINHFKLYTTGSFLGDEAIINSSKKNFGRSLLYFLILY